MNLFELLTADANLSAEFRRQFVSPMSEERKQELRDEQREDEKRDARIAERDADA